MTRKDAREFMMRVFYQMDMQNDFDENDMEKYFETVNAKDQLDYCRQLCKELCQHKAELDEKIGQYSQGWKIERMPKTDIATLRLALCEIRYIDDVPEAVAINEAVELAKKYGTEQSPKFVNAILGSISRE
jgi:transcription antitermination factor NusB